MKGFGRAAAVVSSPHIANNIGAIRKIIAPKTRIMAVVKAAHQVAMTAPVEIGDTVLQNAADTGVDIIATRKIGRA